MAKAAGTASRMSTGESKLLRDFFLGSVKVHVLNLASRSFRQIPPQPRSCAFDSVHPDAGRRPAAVGQEGDA
jgi:hypothetical protein